MSYMAIANWEVEVRYERINTTWQDIVMTQDTKQISVIVCTYNRCNSLKPTLKSLSEQSFRRKTVKSLW